MNSVLFTCIVVLLISCAFVIAEPFYDARYPRPLPPWEYNKVTRQYPSKSKSFMLIDDV